MTNEEHVNYINYHDIWNKYQTLDINIIHYNFIHIRITHPANMHVDFEIYMIIIASWMENRTCSTLPILWHICTSSAFLELAQCVCLLSEK